VALSLVAGALVGATASSADEVTAPVTTPVASPAATPEASAPAVTTPVAETETRSTAKPAKVALVNVGLPEARQAELAYAVGLGKGGDTRGRMASLYTGRWFVPKAEKTRLCIIDREANYNYKAVSRGGHWRGAYQMNRGLALGALSSMRAEVRKEMGQPGVALLDGMRKQPTQTWNRYWQDRAFWTIWRDGKGKGHWSGGAWGCFHHLLTKKQKAKIEAAKKAAAKKAKKAKEAKEAKAKKAKAKKVKAKKAKAAKNSKKAKAAKKAKAKKAAAEKKAAAKKAKPAKKAKKAKASR
jgi:cell division protein FtsN